VTVRAVLAHGRSLRRRTAAAVTAVEAALGISIGGSILAVAVPAFVRELHASRFAEPIAGLGVIGEGAVAYAAGLPVEKAFPAPAPLTPPRPPRAVLAADPPGTWRSATWMALHFPPSPGSGRAFTEEQPHAFAFAFDSALSPARSAFVAHAHGDLDGDGVFSTFELRGHELAGDAAGASIDPGMYIQDELE
jgi:hypothetical protein